MSENQQTNSTPMDDFAGDPQNRTEDQMLADIMRTSPIAQQAGVDAGSLTEEQADVPAPGQDDERDGPPCTSRK